MCLKTLFQKKEPPVKQTFLKDFATFEDLDAWFDLHKELRMEAPNLCDDYSRETRVIAELDGYFLGCHLVYQGACYGAVIFPDKNAPGKPDAGVYHIGNIAIVTSTEEVYYVDLAFGKLIRLCNFITGGKY